MAAAVMIAALTVMLSAMLGRHDPPLALRSPHADHLRDYRSPARRLPASSERVSFTAGHPG
jgi:hypothetical protein